MRISIYGAGYVGVVSAACLVRDGHTVTVIDPVPGKVSDIAAGMTPISEPGIAKLLEDGHSAGRLFAFTEPDAGLQADMIWICVGTPSRQDGNVDLSAVETVCRQIGEELANEDVRPLLVIRSTVPPGTTAGLLTTTVESSSRLEVGADVQVVFHPEFLREGSAVEDFDNPSKIVIGENHVGAGDLLAEIYRGYDAPLFRVTTGEAELGKYADNLFHAVKITFANELGKVGRGLGVDSRRVADMLQADTKLNISRAYLRPGFAFGGSCLPKDTRAILRQAELSDVRIPMLSAVLTSNRLLVDQLAATIIDSGVARVGMIGLAFKEDTDDMRESPYVDLAKQLIGEGIELAIYDPGVDPGNLIGSNKQAAQASLRHLESLLVESLDHMLGCDLILIGHRTVDAELVDVWLDAGIRVIDLVDVPEVDRTRGRYEGIAW